MESLLNGTLNILLMFLGIGKIIAEWDEKPWMVILVFFFITMTITWMVKLTPKIAAGAGRHLGGYAIGMGKMMLGVLVTIWAANFLISLAATSIGSVLGQIPLIGSILVTGWSWVVGSITGIILAIMIVVYIYSNFKSLVMKAMGTVDEAKEDWRDANGCNGETKWLYVIAVVFPVAAMINHPEINEPLWFAPSIVSLLLGMATLALKTAFGKKHVTNIKDKMTKGPNADGSTKCINFKMEPVEKKVNGNVIAVKMKKVWCKGPQGKDRDDNPYNGRNPKGARYCMSPYCDHPNPYWQACWKDEGGCGLGELTPKLGDIENMFPREPDKPVVCPDCNKTWLALPESTPFHLPGEDKYNVRTPGAPAPVPQPNEQAPTGGGLTTIQPPQVDDPHDISGVITRNDNRNGRALVPCPECNFLNRPEALRCKDCGRLLEDEEEDEYTGNNAGCMTFETS